MTSVGDWSEIINEADAERFVGREPELDNFTREINLPKPRYLIFYISGQGGVGKTTLLNRYREIAKNSGFLVLDTDEQQRDIATNLGRFARQLAESGFPLKRFDERYKIYRQKMHEIENDPEAPQGLAALLGRSVVRAAYIGGDFLPGLRKGLEYLPREALESQASEWATYLVKKLTNKEEVAFIREPVPILTPLFFEDLNEIAKRQRVLLCFENFEATRQELQEWLLRLAAYKPSQNVRIVIAGRDQPGAQWDPLRRVTMTILLDVFNEQEAETFLDTYSITNVKRRIEIIECSGRLPVLMSWLASAEGQVPDPSIPAHEIVGRFLRWVDEPALRQVALLAAIPRNFNADILKFLLEKQNQTIDEQTAFDWLLTMPFVQQRSNGWQYHDVVRRMMLNYQRQKSPQAYQQTQIALANFYSRKRDELGLPNDKQWKNELWREITLAYAYHFLIADPTKHWGEVMSLFMSAVRKRRVFAVEMVEMMSSGDVQEELSSEQCKVLLSFRQQLQAIKNGHLQDGFELFNKPCSMTDLTSQAKGNALAYRGECYRLSEKWEKALSDMGDALNYFPEDTWTIAHRGYIYRKMQRYDEALADLDRAIALDENYTWAIINRGETYHEMKNYQEALADWDRAIALNDRESHAFAHRGNFHFLMKHYQEALVDLDKAITLDEKNKWAIVLRAKTYGELRHYQEAFIDFDLAIALDEKDEWVFAQRGETYRHMGRYQEALVNFSRAIALDDKYIWAFSHRGDTFRLMGRYEEALADFERAIALDRQGKSNGTCAFAHRGYTYSQMGRFEEALADFERAIVIDEQDHNAFAHRGVTYSRMGRFEEALADFERAIVINEQGTCAYNHRSKTYLQMGCYEEAVADLDRTINLNDKNLTAIILRSEVYRQMGRYEKALVDLDRINSLDVARAIDLSNSRGLVLSYLGRYDEAVDVYEQGLKEEPDSFNLLYNIAVAMARWKGFFEVQNDIDKARVLLKALANTDAHNAALYGLGGLEALAGNIDQALDYLQQAISASNVVANWARHDVAWLDLRSNPRFQSLISEIQITLPDQSEED